MKMALLIAFALFLLGVLSGLAWRRAKNKGQQADLVAKSNHKSVWSFHYGPASVLPTREPANVSPRLSADSPLSQLIPEDIEAKEYQLKKAEEAARFEAAQALEKEGQHPTDAQPDEADSSIAETTVSSTEATPPKVQDGSANEAPALLSSRHAPGARINVLDLLGTDEAPVTKVTAAAEMTPVVGEEPTKPASADAEDAPVPPTLFTNPLTEATGTKNDEANRRAAVELKKRNRAALRTGTDGQKAALAALITETAAPA